MNALEIILKTINVFVVVGGTVGNLIILILIAKKKKKMEDITNYFIFNLSLADFAISSFVIPLSLAHASNMWIPGEWECSIIMPILEHFAGVCVLTHTAIGIIRHMVVSQRRIIENIKFKHVLFVIGLIWILSFIIISGSMMGGLGRFILVNITEIIKTNKKKSFECQIDFYENKNREKIYAVTIFLLTYIIPMVCTGFSYYRIHRVVSDNAKSLKGHVPEDLLISRKRSSRRLNRILLTMYIFFGSTTLPIQGLYFITGIMGSNKIKIFALIWQISFALFYLQVVANPLLLLYMGPEYRKELFKLSSFFCFSSNFREPSLKIKERVKIVEKKYYKRTSTEQVMKLFTSRISTKRYRFNVLKAANSNRNLLSCKCDQNLTFNCSEDIEKIPMNTNGRTEIASFPKLLEQQHHSKELVTSITSHPSLIFIPSCLPISDVEYFSLPCPQDDAFFSKNSFSTKSLIENSKSDEYMQKCCSLEKTHNECKTNIHNNANILFCIDPYDFDSYINRCCNELSRDSLRETIL